MRFIYQILKWVNIFNAARRGPAALIRQRGRALIVKEAARVARRVFPR